MGYLRGSNIKPSKTITYHTRYRQKKSLKQEVDALKRRVSRNTPAPYTFRQALEFQAPALAGNYVIDTVNLTDNFVTSGTYHDNVTGDWFVNNWLKLRFTTVSDCIRMRVVVYCPRRVGTSFIPASSAGGFVSQPDITAFKVYRDVTSDLMENSSPRTLDLWIPFSGMKTCFDTDTNLIEKNEIKVLVMLQSSTLASPSILTTMGSQLSIADK